MKRLIPLILSLAISACAACASIGYPQKVTQQIEFVTSTDQLVTHFELPSADHGEYLLPLIIEARKHVQEVVLDPGLYKETKLFGVTSGDLRTGKWIQMRIDTSVTVDTQVMTLLHELGHIKHGLLVGGPMAEVVAEAVAYEAGLELGIDTSRQSLSYLSQFDRDKREETLRIFECQIKQWSRELVNAARN